MVKAANEARDATNKMVEALGFTVRNNSLSTNRKMRELYLELPAPKFKSTATRNAWKHQQKERLKAAGFTPNWYFEIRNGILNVGVTINNEDVPGYVAPTAQAKTSTHDLPKSVASYIVNDLGRSLNEVLAHRIVNGEEPKYAVLMGNPHSMFVVVFVGQYKARRPLGPWEEATRGNAQLVSWSCLYDAEEWTYTVERFKNAPYDYF